MISRASLATGGKPFTAPSVLGIALAWAGLLAVPALPGGAEAAPRRTIAPSGRSAGADARRATPRRRIRRAGPRRRIQRLASRRQGRSLRPARRLDPRQRLREVHRLRPPRQRPGARQSQRRARPPEAALALPAMPLYHVHNREAIQIRLYDTRGRLRAAAFRQFARFMRCTHTGRAIKIHWRLLVVLYDLWLHFGQPQVSVFSGHRPKVVARLKTSKHVTGHAIDFNFDAVSNVRVRTYLLRHYPQLGVGYYPNGFHLHLDVRPKRTFWIDYGGPGEDAMYSRQPYQDLRQGTARRGFRPRRRTLQRVLPRGARPRRSARGRHPHRH